MVAYGLIILGAVLVVYATLGLARHTWRCWRAAHHRRRNAEIAARDAARRALHKDWIAGRREGNGQ